MRTVPMGQFAGCCLTCSREDADFAAISAGSLKKSRTVMAKT
jgi:hypothetical protein